VLQGAVDKKEVDEALRAINRSLGSHVPNREDMCPDCKTAPEITNLFNKSAVKGALDMLLGSYHPVGGGQIALRFPGDNTVGHNEVPPNWQDHWHIDGLGDHANKQKSSLYGDISNFTALVGVVLQDACEDFMGNLVVYSGSHIELQEYFKANGFEDLYTQGVSGLPRMRFQRGHRQLHLRAGDAIIANYCTAHTIAPNISPYIRYSVYFRVTSKTHGSGNRGQSSVHVRSGMKHRPESMLDVWCDWPGLKRHMTVATATSQAQGQLLHRQQQIELEEERQLRIVLERSKHDT